MTLLWQFVVWAQYSAISSTINTTTLQLVRRTDLALYGATNVQSDLARVGRRWWRCSVDLSSFCWFNRSPWVCICLSLASLASVSWQQRNATSPTSWALCKHRRYIHRHKLLAASTYASLATNIRKHQSMSYHKKLVNISGVRAYLFDWCRGTYWHMCFSCCVTIVLLPYNKDLN